MTTSLTGSRYSSSKIVNTKYKCRACNSMIIKYINTAPDELIGKFMCLCTSANGDPISPQFPIYEAE